ncbi:hypothetical protein MASR2M48_04820 [Spirochaetota bacterium]
MIQHRNIMALGSMMLATMFLAGSCVTIAPVTKGLESERLLPADALAYARLDKATLAAAMAMLPGTDAKNAGTLANRTHSMTAAFVRIPGSSKTGLLAVAIGKYPAGAASLGLSSDKTWSREGAVWERKDGTLRLAFADGGRVFLEPFRSTASSPRRLYPMPTPFLSAGYRTGPSQSPSTYPIL